MKGIVVTGTDRSGVADAVVSAWRVDDRPGDVAPISVATTGGDGRFVLDLPIRVPVGRGDVVLRTYLGEGAADLDPRALVSVIQRAVPQKALLEIESIIWLAPAPQVFGRVWLDGAPAGTGLTVVASDQAGARRRTETARGGRFTLGMSGELRLCVNTGGQDWVADWSVSAERPEADARFSVAETLHATGRVSRRADGAGLPGLRVELLDRAGRWVNPVGATTTTETGEFVLTFPRLVDRPPEATFTVWSRDERIAVVDWAGPGLTGVDLVLGVAPGRPVTYRLDAQALDRVSRAPVPDLRAEVWDAGFGILLKQAVTDGDGRISVAVQSGDVARPPELGLRLYRDGVRVAEQRVPQAVWHADLASVFCEVDLPAAPPVVHRVMGRLVDQVSWSGVAGLRVEAWDQSPRPGGLLGAAAYTARDGTFDLAIPATARPALLFRLYSADALVATFADEVVWDGAGTGSVLLRVASVPDADGEVVLHELGETIATAVNRMQGELSRYPSTMGAYVVDELDFSVPVAVQLDKLGQVRAKVVDRAPVDEQLGRIRMRVRPVLGAHLPRADQLDQPLSALAELGPDAIAALNGLRVYSVEDLARLATTSAGAAALAALGLGLDLAALLDKAALLAMGGVPRPVREALVALGLAGVRAFAFHPDPAALGAALTDRLGQEITADAVRSWQLLARDRFTIPLPEPGGTHDGQR